MRRLARGPLSARRAMACLKIFRFEQAEEDCNRALAFQLAPADKVRR